MLNYVIAIVMMIVSALACFAAIDKKTAEKVRIFSILSSEDDFESKSIRRIETVIIISAVAIMSFFAALRLMFQVEDTVNIVRVLLLFIPIVCAGCIDYREKRIPNIISAFLLVEGIVFLGIEFFVNREAFKSYAVSCLISFFGCLIILSLAGLITRKGIGNGDIKLLSTFGLVGGVYMLCGTIIIATLLSAIVALFFLITKKKNLKSSLPFGPFIAIGFFASIIANIY